MTLALPLLGLAALLALGVGLWLYAPDRSRSELEATYLKAPTDYLDVAGMRLHLRDIGPRQAPAVIMLHGFGASLQTFEPWAEALSRDFRVVMFDLPGFGLTGPDPTGDYTDARSLQVLLALMDRLGIGRASLVGNSIGGRIAWTFAALHPDRVDRLVLIAPDGFASKGFAYGKKAEVPAVMNLMRWVLPTRMVRASLVPAYGDPGRVDNALVTRYRDLMLAPGVRKAMLDRLGQVILEDPAPLLRRVRTPTLLVWGEEDRMIPVANAADYQRYLPDARLVTFQGLGHVPHEEDPARTLPAVHDFLQGEGGAVRPPPP